MVVDKVTEFLIKHEYFVSIKPIKKGVELGLPEIKNKILTQSQKNIKFTFKRGKNSKLYIDDGTKTSIELPDYMIKYFTLYQLLNKCKVIGYNIDNIVVLDKDGKINNSGLEAVENIIKSSRGEEGLKEEMLTEIISEYTVGGNLLECRTKADKNSILDGFDLMLNLLQQGQIEDGN